MQQESTEWSKRITENWVTLYLLSKPILKPDKTHVKKVTFKNTDLSMRQGKRAYYWNIH